MSYGWPTSTEGQDTPASDKICTSYVERQDLTVGMNMPRFTTVTNAFGKEVENLKAAVALHFTH